MRERGVVLGKERHGTVPLHGALLPEVATQLRLLLDAVLNPRSADGPRFRDDDDPAPSVHDDRTGAQKRHDALAGILAVAARHESAPTMGGAAPTLVVTVSADDITGENGAAFLAVDEESAGAVSARVARHVGCAGAVQRVVLGTEGNVIRLLSPERTFPAHLRRAIAARDGTCVIPGCNVPAHWGEIHHVEPAARGGPTHADNGVVLCWIHHRTIETSGWEIRMMGGAPWVRAPHWIDPSRSWQPHRGSPTRQLSALRR
jgi:hypothetical protein